MSWRPFLTSAQPAPKPVSAARWLPLAKKHGMWIDFQIDCVSVLEPNITEFWGEEFAEQDVGALVLRVAKMVDDAKNEKAPPDAPRRAAGAPP